VGEVTSGTFSPSLQQGIALAYVGYGAGSPGKQFSVRDRESESRRITMEQVLAPFYRTGTRRSARNAS
jgi:glycine cleavage system aminomethyltransferase T